MSLPKWVKFWPWLVPLAFIGIYETIALMGPAPTLSALVWEADATIPWLDWAVMIGLAVLCWHFFFQKRR